jgi:hypothetical protein
MAATPSVQREVTVAQRKWLYSNKKQKDALLEFFTSWRYISQLYCTGCMGTAMWILYGYADLEHAEEIGQFQNSWR